MDSDFFDSYSITACRIDCETRYLVENCNCRMVHMPGQAPQLQTQAWAPRPNLPLTSSPCTSTSYHHGRKTSWRLPPPVPALILINETSIPHPYVSYRISCLFP